MIQKRQAFDAFGSPIEDENAIIPDGGFVRVPMMLTDSKRAITDREQRDAALIAESQANADRVQAYVDHYNEQDAERRRVRDADPSTAAYDAMCRDLHFLPRGGAA